MVNEYKKDLKGAVNGCSSGLLYFKMNQRLSKQRLKELVYDSYSFVSLFREIRASSR